MLIILYKNIKLEPFEERYGHKWRKVDITKCSTYNCLRHTENTCDKWCLDNVKNEDISYICRRRCRQLTKDMNESMMYQYRTFGDSMYKFNKERLFRNYFNV